MELIVSNSPHLKTDKTVTLLMGHVIIALLPVIAASIYFFGYRAVFLIANCVIVSILSEHITLKIRKKPSQIKDCSAALTGLLLALILPPTTVWYAASLASIFAIVVAKHLFGGLGANIFNPALIGRAFLMVAYPTIMVTYIAPFKIDAITAPTPLALRQFENVITPIKQLFLGSTAGSLGETSAVCLILGGIYLLARKIADWRIPVSLLLTTVLFSFIVYLVNPSNGSVSFHFLSGGLLLGALFMATDPVTTPVTKKGRYIFGVSCGIFIMARRYLGDMPEGVMYSILFMNAFTPLINRYTKPKPFGKRENIA